MNFLWLSAKELETLALSVEAAVETEVAPEEAPAAEEAALIECAHCKLQIPAIAKFCPDCGKKLRQE